MTKRIAEYEGAEYKKGRDKSSTIENEEWYTIPRKTAPFKTSTTTENYFDTILFNMEVNVYVKRKSMLK